MRRKNSKLEIQQCSLLYFREKISTQQTVLLVGAGASALKYEEMKLRRHYDIVISINNASATIEDADIYSVEPHSLGSLKEMIEPVDEMCREKIYFKSAAFKRLIKSYREPEKISELLLHLDSKRIKLFKPIIVPPKIGLKARLILALHINECVQWSGSLSAWIDLLRKLGVKQIGLIGTDFGGPYAIKPSWISDTPKFHSLAEKSDTRKYTFFDVARGLRSKGYFSNIQFTHYHYSDEFRALLS